MREHDTAFALSVQIGVDDAPVLSWKRNVLLRHGKSGQEQSGQEQSENVH